MLDNLIWASDDKKEKREYKFVFIISIAEFTNIAYIIKYNDELQ